MKTETKVICLIAVLLAVLVGGIIALGEWFGGAVIAICFGAAALLIGGAANGLNRACEPKRSEDE